MKTGTVRKVSDFSGHVWGRSTTSVSPGNLLVPRIMVLMDKTFVLGKEGVLDSGFLTAFNSFSVAMSSKRNRILVRNFINLDIRFLSCM